MTLPQIFIILAIHWVADFVLQTDEMAKNKSTSNKALLEHAFVYSWIWFLSGSIIQGLCGHPFHQWFVTLFVLITFVCHTITDYFTSRLNKRLWEKKDVHNFFVSVGFDQVLHYIQLFLTFYLLTK